MKIDTPASSGTYNLKVVAFYDRTSVLDYDTIDVRNKIEFEIVSIDKDWVTANDNITIKLKALEKGGVIELNKNNVDIKIGSANIEITSISRQGDLFNVKITTPNIGSGKYQLEAYLDHEGSSYSDTEPINYVVEIKGKLGKGVELRFIKNDEVEHSLITDAYGYYSTSLPPDVYDIEVVFPQSTLYLYEVSVSSFDDPIKYGYSETISVPGIRNAGLFSFEVDLSYSDIDIEMRYIEKNVLNEEKLEVFECSNWNVAKDKCNDEWILINSEIDTIRNKAKVDSITLSAFVVGEIKSMNVDFSLDRGSYILGDKIVIRGIVKDEDGSVVNNASIDVQIKNTEIKSKTTADENGVFSIEIPAPEFEGDYKLSLKSKKYPYTSFSDEKDFKVVKSKSVFIDFPDTVKIERGSNFTQEFSLVNNGQADIEDITISLEGLSENYYKIISDNIDLDSEERKTLYIDFSVPVYAEPGISSVTLKIENGNLSEEKVFGLNIFEKTEENITTISPGTGLGTGFVFPEISYLEIIYIIIFAAVCFSVAIIFKKRKVKKRGKNSSRNFLFDIKNIIEREEPQKTIKQKSSGSYDKIIATEFPSFLKFSKNLTKIKGGENGKDN